MNVPYIEISRTHLKQAAERILELEQENAEMLTHIKASRDALQILGFGSPSLDLFLAKKEGR